jgi:hypothetical protein
MSTHRTKSIGTKVTADEFAALNRVMGTRKPAEWVRDVLLATLRPNAREFVLLAEVMALRIILLNTHLALAVGEKLTDERVRKLIADADREKGRQATERLARAVSR